MHFYPSERVALLIDGANLYATSKALAFDIDYKRLLTLFRQRNRITTLFNWLVAYFSRDQSLRMIIRSSKEEPAADQLRNIN